MNKASSSDEYQFCTSSSVGFDLGLVQGWVHGNFRNGVIQEMGSRPN